MGGAALHFGWVAEMKTGEGKTLVSTLPVYLNGADAARACTSSPSTTTWPRRDAEWMGQIHRWLGPQRRARSCPATTTPTHKRAQYACDITYGTNNEFGFDYLRDNMAMRRGRPGPAGPQLRHRRRGRLDPHRRGPHAAHHLRPGRRRRQALLPVRQRSSAASSATATTRSTRRSAPSPPPRRASRRSSRRSASRTSTTSVDQNLVHQLQAALQGQGAVQARQGLHRRRRRGEDRRRVHRPHPRGPALVRGPAPGGRGQGGREDQGGEPDPRHDHPPELLPHVRQARRHDRHGRRPRPPSSPAPTTCRSCPIPTNRPMVRVDQRRPHLQDRGRQVRRRRRRHRRALRDGPAGARRHHLGREVREARRACSTSGASPTRCSTPSSTTGRPRSSPRPAGSTRSPWPPTWPAAASTSSSAATPRAWPSATRRPRASSPSTDEGQARVRRARSPSTRPSAKAEGDKVRELGGLYVLGTERHERRRIDNQLRGRSGRQGDPGESRFYLSLEDELMRLFATGAMNWVMGKALPDDVPIEAKMVTKAIERAQNTVEQRNAEIRKNVLKYDEVMNEQRKVIYARRDQILDGADLRERGASRPSAEAVERARRHLLRRRVRRGVGPRRAASPRRDVLARPSSPPRSSAQCDVDRRAVRAAHGRGRRLLRAARGRRSAPSACARSSAR